MYVARHGETEWNNEGRYQGQRESRLTSLGERQAAALAEALSSSRAGRVISSPLSRCSDTAMRVARRLGVEVETDDRLLEIAHGSWEGRLRADVERDDAARMRAWREAPASVTFEGGESLADVDVRWRAFAASIDGENDVVVVTHDVLVRLAILAATHGPLENLWQPCVRNGGYAVFEGSGKDWRLVDECRDEHLEGMLTDSSRQAL